MTDIERRRALATGLRMAQWAIDDAAFKLPRGELADAKQVELAGILHDLADLLLVALPPDETQGKTRPAGSFPAAPDHGQRCICP